MHPETIYIIDDDPSVRDAMSLLLSLQGHVSATFATAEDFIAALQPHWRGCVVADIRMPGMSGLELQAVLRERAAALPVIIITAHGDVAAARRAFLNHAVDFIEKPFEAEALLAAVRHAMARGREDARASPGEQARQGGPAGTAAQPGSSEARATESAATTTVMLSPREYEVMQLLVKGLHNRRIAETLGISHRTVEVHKARVLAKLNVRTVIELVRLVDSQGIG